MDLNKHVVKNSNDHLLHSSGFARVANGDRLGSTSSVSFNQRLQINSNRRLVSDYSRSTIGRGYSVARPKQYSPGARDANINNSLQQHNSLKPSEPRHFTEPGARNFNPYS